MGLSKQKASEKDDYQLGEKAFLHGLVKIVE